MAAGYNAGAAQAYMAWQKSMMAYQQAQMDNYMQKQSALSKLSQAINRLQTQAYEILYGGSTSVSSTFQTTGGVYTGGGGDTKREKTKRSVREKTKRSVRDTAERRRYRPSH